ncbi:hypothetical protein [Carbonactinospora thermoautotrophica]|uniref:hypothetical protein n=1 Tax=Carbonactinospora thermoautotrophica TaxID=1469144 RepID=UPI00226E82B9|nr:hypothetical protein [Carbonactinospora thermoautotrophica]
MTEHEQDEDICCGAARSYAVATDPADHCCETMARFVQADDLPMYYDCVART